MNKIVAAKKFLTTGDYFKEMRLKKGMTQDEVARSLGYRTKQIVSNWECGRCAPPLDKLYQLIKILNLDKDEVISVFLEETERNLLERISPKPVRKRV